MGFFNKLLRLFWNHSERIVTSQDLAQLLSSMHGGAETAAGVSVSPESAMRCIAVYACVRILAESVAQLPLHTYRRITTGGKEQADDHPLEGLLNFRPNPWQTAFEFKEMMMGHLALRGNAYAFVNRLGSGEVVELIPLHPGKMTIEQRPDYQLAYTYTPDNKPLVKLRQDQVFHLRLMTIDGIRGLSPIAQAREAIGLALATERHGAKLFSNGAQPAGMLQMPPGTNLSEVARANLKADFKAHYTGSDHAFETMILEEGLSWSKVGMTSEDSQFLESRKYQRTEIASLYGVPPHRIGDLERATFSNIEHQSIEFVMHSLMPWLKRWEGRVNVDFLSGQDYFCEFLVDGLLRGDTLSRYQAYTSAIAAGWMNRNEVRAKENLNLADGLDEFLVPVAIAQQQPPDSSKREDQQPTNERPQPN